MAKMLGVNVSSVSRALKGQKGVGEELRQKIERMAFLGGSNKLKQTDDRVRRMVVKTRLEIRESTRNI